MDEKNNKIRLNVLGSNKGIEIDLVKLRDAITVLDTPVEESAPKQSSSED